MPFRMMVQLHSRTPCKALLVMCASPWNTTRIFVTKDEHCLATDVLAHARQEPDLRHNVKHVVSRATSATAMAKRWNIRSDGVCVSCAVASCSRP